MRIFTYDSIKHPSLWNKLLDHLVIRVLEFVVLPISKEHADRPGTFRWFTGWVRAALRCVLYC